MANKVLLVEGRTDVEFFGALCNRLLSERISIEPRRPKEIGARQDGADSISTLLPSLLDLLETGDISRLGIVTDADYASDRKGFSARRSAITECLARQNYRITDAPVASGTGELFHHPDGLPPVGLWIMPDHRGEGMLEHFIAKAVQADQQALFDLAQKVVAEIPDSLLRFRRDTHARKAEVGTWLAWQKKPLLTANIPREQLIALDSPTVAAFKLWLQQTFPD